MDIILLNGMVIFAVFFFIVSLILLIIDGKRARLYHRKRSIALMILTGVSAFFAANAILFFVLTSLFLLSVRSK